MFVSPVSHLGLTVFMQLLFGFKSLADNWSVHTQLDEAGYSHWLGVSDPPSVPQVGQEGGGPNNGLAREKKETKGRPMLSHGRNLGARSPLLSLSHPVKSFGLITIVVY